MNGSIFKVMITCNIYKKIQCIENSELSLFCLLTISQGHTHELKIQINIRAELEPTRLGKWLSMYAKASMKYPVRSLMDTTT